MGGGVGWCSPQTYILEYCAADRSVGCLCGLTLIEVYWRVVLSL